MIFERKLNERESTRYLIRDLNTRVSKLEKERKQKTCVHKEYHVKITKRFLKYVNDTLYRIEVECPDCGMVFTYEDTAVFGQCIERHFARLLRVLKGK